MNFSLTAHLKAEALEAWIDAGWLVPRDDGEGRHFSEVDLARAQLIHDLQDLGVNDDAIPVILDLVDQLHGLRRVLREVLSTVTAQSGSAKAPGFLRCQCHTLAGAQMIPLKNAVPSRYPPMVTWMLIATNCLVFLFQNSLSPLELEMFLRDFALIPARYTAGLAYGELTARRLSFRCSP